jgi:hypothetical protein
LRFVSEKVGTSTGTEVQGKGSSERMAHGRAPIDAVVRVETISEEKERVGIQVFRCSDVQCVVLEWRVSNTGRERGESVKRFDSPPLGCLASPFCPEF